MGSRSWSTISSLLDAFKRILEIKKLIDGLRENNVPDSSMKGLVEHANTEMSATITKITEEIVTEKNGIKSEKRRNEVKIEIKNALGFIVTSMDKGINFEVRASPSHEADDQAKKPTPAQVRANDALREIAENQKSLFFVKSDTDPILNIPANLENAQESKSAKGA